MNGVAINSRGLIQKDEFKHQFECTIKTFCFEQILARTIYKPTQGVKVKGKVLKNESLFVQLVFFLQENTYLYLRV